MEKNNKTKKVVFGLFFAFIFIFNYILYENNQYISYKLIMPKDSYKYNMSNIIELNGIERNNIFFNVTTDSAYFKIKSDKKVKSVSFLVNTEKKNELKLYYSSTDTFSEIDTYVQVWENRDKLTFQINKENVNNFMVKIKDSCRIDSIMISSNDAEMVVDKKSKRDDKLFLLGNLFISLLTAYFLIIKNGEKILNVVKGINNHKILIFFKRFILYTFTLLLLFAIQLCFTRGLVIKGDSYYSINIFRLIFTIGLNTFFWGIVWLRKCFKTNQIEKIFLLVSLCIGIPFAISLPMLQESTWDAGIHYGNTVDLLYFNSDSLPAIDQTVGWLNYSYNVGELKKIEDKYNYNYDISGIAATTDKNLVNYYNKVGYIPLATGIFVARGIKMSFTQSIIMGKVFNIIFYAYIIYFAIKRIKNGKLLLFIISLYPTAMMLAGTYSYDSWVISLMYLGLSYLFANFQEKDSYLTLKDAMIIGLSLFLSLGPKAIYFPIMLLCLFLPKNKFKSFKEKRLYNLFIVFLMCLSLLSFMLPFLTGVSNQTLTGDTRGGSDVNSVLQVKYILSNPIEYTKTLLVFLKNYWSISNVSNYTTYLAYIPGVGKFSILLIINILATLIVGYKDSLNVKNWINRLFSIILIFGISCLVATALYISYTPVGLLDIAGCQPRYLLPLLFPLAYVLCNVYKPINVNKEIFNYIVCGVSSFVLIYNVFFQVIMLYWIS